MRKSNTDYVRAYRERCKATLHDALAKARHLETEAVVLRHNLDVRERETEMAWRQIAQLDAALCKTLGRQWKHEDIPEEAASSTVWQLARSIWTDQLKPIPEPPTSNGFDD
jgi:hypothetical protein